MKRRKLEENIFNDSKTRLATIFLIILSSLLISALAITIFEFFINLI